MHAFFGLCLAMLIMKVSDPHVKLATCATKPGLFMIFALLEVGTQIRAKLGHQYVTMPHWHQREATEGSAATGKSLTVGTCFFNSSATSAVI